ncbi:TAXI family TRAP transporter solute-binding subunit [Microvirga vignae]|uniref:TAXI family TRAP transporter solute-binding subunit n=1 Tax=Microvirga vignae TaxID=1225564 RepID=UPI000B13AA0C|nr:TAXI family TRAP transporter solute-binding subunit [Microvirga vignae]
MVPGSVTSFWAGGLAAALLLLTELILPPAVAQTPPSTPSVKQAAPARDPNTIGIVAGGPEGGTVPLINEIARVLAGGQETGPRGELALRVLPIVGRGGIHDIQDVLALPGVDMTITREHLLMRLQEGKELGDLRSKLVYVTKLFNEEVHLIAREDIRQISDLVGKPVNFGSHGGSVEDIARDLFRMLGLEVSEVHLELNEAIEEMRQGRIAATIFLAPKPAAIVDHLTRGGGFRLVQIPYLAQATPYLPASLHHEDYPSLIPTGERVETIALGTVLIAYNWPEKSGRYQLLSNFVDAFFSRFSELQAARQHPKWQDVNLAAVLPGWSRFRPAERWLQTWQAQQAGIASTGSVSRSDRPRRLAPEGRDTEMERLFEEFLQWREQRGKR